MIKQTLLSLIVIFTSVTPKLSAPQEDGGDDFRIAFTEDTEGGADSEQLECAICMEPCSHSAYIPTPHCSHGFCVTCYASLQQHNTRTCPLCRAPMNEVGETFANLRTSCQADRHNNEHGNNPTISELQRQQMLLNVIETALVRRAAAEQELLEIQARQAEAARREAEAARRHAEWMRNQAEEERRHREEHAEWMRNHAEEARRREEERAEEACRHEEERAAQEHRWAEERVMEEQEQEQKAILRYEKRERESLIYDFEKEAERRIIRAEGSQRLTERRAAAEASRRLTERREAMVVEIKNRIMLLQAEGERAEEESKERKRQLIEKYEEQRRQLHKQHELTLEKIREEKRCFLTSSSQSKHQRLDCGNVFTGILETARKILKREGTVKKPQELVVSTQNSPDSSSSPDSPTEKEEERSTGQNKEEEQARRRLEEKRYGKQRVVETAARKKTEGMCSHPQTAGEYNLLWAEEDADSLLGENQPTSTMASRSTQLNQNEARLQTESQSFIQQVPPLSSTNDNAAYCARALMALLFFTWLNTYANAKLETPQQPAPNNVLTQYPKRSNRGANG